jgi:glycosyltransferase involved in cell wall biosynthesis
MHVLTLTPFFPSADDDGAGCFVAEPLPWIQQFGISTTVIAAQPFYRDTRARSSAHVHWATFFSIPSNAGLPSAGRFFYANIVRRVREIHRSDPVHLIHAHSALPCGHAAALLKHELGIPYVVSVHGLDAYSDRQAGRFIGRLCARVSRWVYNTAECVICVSKRVEDRVRERTGGNARTEVVYNGVDSEFFSAAENQGETLLSVGNLTPIKNHELLLRAFAAIAANFPDLQCEIIGDGPERRRLERLADRLNISGRVFFLGRQTRTQVAEAIRRCAVFALPSRYEALGCVYLEAMACGKPVIACRGQGIGELIEHGSNGWLVGSDSLDEMVSTLNLLLANSELRERMGRVARATMVNGFTLEHQAGRLAEIYRKCVV